MERSSTDILSRLMEHLDRDDPAWGDFMALESGRWPPYRTDRDLAAIRDESRWFAANHPFAAAALEVRASYIVGTGHTYSIRPKPGIAIDDDDVRRIEAEIVDFTERNLWQHRQIENQIRLDRDGEVFIRVFDVNGRLAVRYIEPELVTAPPGENAPLGIVLDPRDAETVSGYWVRWPGMRPENELLPAESVQHRKLNADLSMPRGIPTLFAVRANLRRAWKLLRNMTTVASIQAAVAAVRMHGATNAGSVQQFTMQMQQVPRSERTPRTYEQFEPGTILDVAPGIDVKFPAEGINIANYVQGVQAELRAVAARLAMPEYMLSGDASNANYASTLVAEGPAVKMFERLQSYTIWWDTELLRRALLLAERYGRLPVGVTEAVVIDAEAPLTQSRNRLAEAQADQILMTMGIVSPQTVAARHGYDYRQEKALMDEAEET